MKNRNAAVAQGQRTGMTGLAFFVATIASTCAGLAVDLNHLRPAASGACYERVVAFQGEGSLEIVCPATSQGPEQDTLVLDRGLQIANPFPAGALVSGNVAVTVTRAGSLTGLVWIDPLASIDSYGAIRGDAINYGTFINEDAGTIVGAITSFGSFANNGTITGNLYVSGGTFGGHGTIIGDFGLNSGAGYQISLNGTSPATLNVTGTATLGSAGLTATFSEPTASILNRYTILSAGSVSGTFLSLTNVGLPANFTDALSYDQTHAYLNLTADFVGSAGISRNAQNVGQAFNMAFASNGSIPAIYASLTPAGLAQASSQTGTGGTWATFDAMDQFGSALMDGSGGDSSARINSELGYGEESPSMRLKSAFDTVDAGAPKPAKSISILDPRWTVWASTFGASGTVAGNAGTGAATTQSQVWGTAVGADKHISPTTILGFGMGGGGTNYSLAGDLGSGHSDVFEAGVSLKQFVGTAYASALLAYSWQDVTTTRTVNTSVLQGRFDANSLQERLEAGNRFDGQLAGVTPFVAGQLTSLFLPAYGETVISGNNAFALNYASKMINQPRTELGVKLDNVFAIEGGSVTLKLSGAWAHDYDISNSVNAAFQALRGASFTTSGATPAPNSALASASVDVKWANGWSVGGTLKGEFSSTTTDFEGKGTVKYTW